MSTCSSSSVRLKELLGAAPWKDDWEGAGAADDSLTDLQWLQEFSFLTAGPEKPCAFRQLAPKRLLQGSDAPTSPPTRDTAAKGLPIRAGRPTSSNTSFAQALHGPPSEKADYRNNAQVKPPYSYATLICMAMHASKEAKLTLSAIYAWITENFGYYRHADPSWQNSIRHNLSLNRCFKKVPRRKGEPGKGGFWQIDPCYADVLVNGVFRQRRRMPVLSSTCVQSSQTSPVASLGSWQGGQIPRRRLRVQRPLGKRHLQSAVHTDRAPWSSIPPSPVAAAADGETAALPGNLNWALVLEDTFADTTSAFEDLELTTALSSLATSEDFDSQIHSQPVGALSKGGPTCPATPVLSDLTLCSDPLPQLWEEEAAAEPKLGPAWAFEEGPCFSECFLAESQQGEG